MGMTARERRALQQLEVELTEEAPRLARTLRAPALWRRLLWGPRRVRMALVGVVLVLLASLAIVLIEALATSPAATH